MNALLIAGVVALGLWIERRLRDRRRAYRPSDDALSHGLGSKPQYATERWRARTETLGRW